ncbi:MAG: hypothetical protein QOC54_2160, partial [Baekduia sp.]|nr:hypothetical protein [Baekduia sp.]
MPPVPTGAPPTATIARPGRGARFVGAVGPGAAVGGVGLAGAVEGGLTAGGAGTGAVAGPLGGGVGVGVVRRGRPGTGTGAAGTLGTRWRNPLATQPKR